ncbi:hypothetical protein D3C81_1753190 [compost metagenome]
MPCPVNKGGFFEIFGRRPEEIQQQDDIEDRHQSRKDQRHQGIHQPKLQNQDVAGNQAAAEQHCDDKIPKINIACPEDMGFLGECVSSNGIHYQG